MSVARLTDEELLLLLQELGHDVPGDYVDELVSRGFGIEAKLIEALDDESTWLCAQDDPARWLPVHLLLALGRRESEQAGLAIARAIRTCERIGGDEMDWITPFWVALLQNKPPRVSESFAEVLVDRSAPEYVRIASATILTASAQRAGEASLSRRLETLAQIVGDEREALPFRQYVATLLLDFPRPQHRSVVEQLAGAWSSHGLMYTMVEVEDAYGRGRDAPEWETFNDPWEFYSEDAIAERYTQEMEEEKDEYETISVDTFVRESPKVGRNEPCPCGSGRKHKKCCLGKPSLDSDL